MAESNKDLTIEEMRILVEAEKVVLSAISAQCSGCSTAWFAPERLAGAVKRGGLSERTLDDIADRFVSCNGFQDNMCHYPLPES